MPKYPCELGNPLYDSPLIDYPLKERALRRQRLRNWRTLLSKEEHFELDFASIYTHSFGRSLPASHRLRLLTTLAELLDEMSTHLIL